MPANVYALVVYRTALNSHNLLGRGRRSTGSVILVYRFAAAYVRMSLAHHCRVLAFDYFDHNIPVASNGSQIENPRI
jgi:hypothetical protein